MTLRTGDAPVFRTLRRSVLLVLCLLVALGASAAFVVDCFDGDDDGGPTLGSELPVLLVATHAFPPPIEMRPLHVPVSHERPTHAPLRTPLCLRAPPAL
jgi:hypothetical protein